VNSKSDRRRVLRVTALAVAALSGALALRLYAGGGFDAPILHLTSHDPRKPAILAALALALFFVAGGRVRINAGPWLSVADRLNDRLAVVALAVALVAVGIIYATTVVGGADSYGYVSEADGWLSGQLKVNQSWAQQAPWPSTRWSFAPLGWRPGDGDDAWSLVPVYSPGLPLMFAGAKLIGGQEAVFWVVPIAGGLLVIATFGLGRRLGDSRAGLIAAALMATSPVVLFMLMVPMTDVPVACAWTIACYFALGESVGTALAAGFAAAVAILIRPNLVFEAGPIGLWFLIRGWRTGEPRRAIGHAACFSVAASCGIGAVAAINQHLYGSALISGYGSFSNWFTPANFTTNLGLYTGWLMYAHTPVALAGLAALLFPLKRVWPGVKDRAVFVMIALYVGVLAAQYLVFLVFDRWWYLRFLIAALPFLMLGVGAIATALARVGKPALTLAVIVAVLALCVRDFVVGANEYAFDLWRGDWRYVAMAKVVRTNTPPTSVIYTMQHSGSIRYYAGRLTLNYSALDNDWLDRSVAWAQEHGSHPYLMLEHWEVEPFKTQFKNQALAEIVDTAPMVMYEGGARIMLWDLEAPHGARSTINIKETYSDRERSVPPVPTSTNPITFAR
jgi:hypothetical protein